MIPDNVKAITLYTPIFQYTVYAHTHASISSIELENVTWLCIHLMVDLYTSYYICYCTSFVSKSFYRTHVILLLFDLGYTNDAYVACVLINLA